MEGISDGRAVDGCFFCELLFPEVESCARCENRMRYQSAAIMSQDEIDTEIAVLTRKFSASQHIGDAETLLQFLHRIGPDALDVFENYSVDLIQLRTLFREEASK